MKDICSIVDCGKKRFCKGWCRRHYQQNYKYGKVLTEEEARSKWAKTKGVCLNTGRTQFKKGMEAWNKGIHHLAVTGDKNNNWKGDAVSYTALHHWVRRHLGKPKKCAECSYESSNIRMFHWANISHEYKRDLTDWIRLCAVCHKAYDSNKLILTQKRG